MKNETQTPESSHGGADSSLSLERRRIERVERFRVRKVRTVEDLLEQLGYDLPDRVRTGTAGRGRRRRYGRAWAWRIGTGRGADRACRRGLSWLR